MQPVHADYKYRRFPKVADRNYRQPPGDLAEFLKEARLREKRRLEQEEREQMLLRLARAERCLRPTEYRDWREYRVAADGTALRRNDAGMRSLETGNITRAFRNFREAIDRDPELGLAHNNIGVL